MTRFFLLFLWAVTTCFLASGQADSLVLQFELAGDFRFFEVDELGNIYTINKAEVLTKHAQDGRPLFHYQNTTLGTLHSLDVRDPFTVLLFFKEQQSLILLDRTLSDLAIIDLRNTAIQYASAVALSMDGNLLVFDDYAGQILKIDRTGKLLLESNDLRLSLNLTSPATHIGAGPNKIYLNVPEKGLAVFSNFLQFERWHLLEALEHIHFHQQYLVCQTKEQTFIYWPAKSQHQLFPPPFSKDFQLFDFHNDFLYLLTTSNLSVYQNISQ